MTSKLSYYQHPVSHRINRNAKIERSDPNGKKKLKRIIEEIEEQVEWDFRNKHLKYEDFYNLLPVPLLRRVKQLISLDEIMKPKDDLVETEPDGDETDIDIKKKSYFNASEMSEVQLKELDHQEINLVIEPRPQPRLDKKIGPVNWTAKYLKQTQRDRVRWDSKLYQFDKNFLDKSLYEQAQELTNIATKEFADWLNSMGSDNKDDISSDLIKQLFSIDIGGDASKALYVEPRPVNAVPEKIADSLKIPELALERCVAKGIEYNIKQYKNPAKYHAFGTSLPMELRWPRPGQEVAGPIQPTFPDNLRTREIVFQGIKHLRSTKSLVKHLKAHPKIPRPKYLVDQQAFKGDSETKGLDTSDYIPLYKYFN